jgi:hypothetical protein
MRLSTNKATRLIQDVVSGNLEIIQPVHWLVEVAAVLARVSPQTAIDDVAMLSAMQFSTNETGQPLFDTLHHAVALEQEDAVLVTADDLYRAKGDRYGKIVGLRDWRIAG